jgi:3-hydroxyisobutyrate dehydrogenase
MTGRLLGAGFPVTVWNRHADRAAPLVEKGARLAESPRDAAADADVVIAMVADDAASRGVWLGDAGALAQPKAGAVMIESSTLSPEWVAELAKHVASRGCEFLDAPVTGSRMHAEAGELAFLVGGSESTLEHVRDVLRPMSRAILHVGPVGSGALIKLVNNFVCGVQTASIAEAMVLIERSGLALDRALPVLLDGAPGSPMVKTIVKRIVDHEQTTNFSIALMRKDLDYAVALGERVGVPLETAATARNSFQRAVDSGLGGRDISAVIEPLR